MTSSEPQSAKEALFSWLRHLNKYKGSDLFVTTNFPPAMKVDGKIVPITEEPLTAERCMEIAFNIMSPKQIEEFTNTNECNFAISLPDTSRFRVNAMVQRGATALVLRAITSKIPSFESLNLPPVLKQISLKKRGLVIFVGGTGSGKSTSLASMIDYRNENSQDHIITIEDPIEFVHQHKSCIISQREVGVDTDNWFAALKNTLRQAPDVILIGEIRDRETMDYAIAFAETGHLCMATLHANSTNQALDRIINFFPEERRTQLLTSCRQMPCAFAVGTTPPMPSLPWRWPLPLVARWRPCSTACANTAASRTAWSLWRWSMAWNILTTARARTWAPQWPR